MTDLYPILPRDIHISSILPDLRKILSLDSVSALRITIDSELAKSDLTLLLKECHNHNVALILSLPSIKNLQYVSFEHADGFHLSDSSLLGELIALLPKKYTQQIGVTASNLDDAMRAGEMGADYISFAPALSEYMQQWNHITELPCVAEPVHNEEDAIKSLQSGADFLGFSLNAQYLEENYPQQLEKLITLNG